MWDTLVETWNWMNVLDKVALGLLVFFAYKKGWPWVSAKIGSVFTTGSAIVARVEALEKEVFGANTKPVTPAQLAGIEPITVKLP
jgi:hypothetical protein